MGNLNVANRTLAIMDNLPFLRSLNNECIDLIAIDPPFAANETFTSRPKPPISEAEFAEEKALAEAHGVQHNEGIGETRVKDYWNWDDDVHPNWKARIEDDYPQVFAVIQAVEACATENEAAYICFMAARLIECRRVLKTTGSIYVHCDQHANSYLRMLLDAIFGTNNYIDEIIWNYGTPSGGRASGKKPVKTHETLLMYAVNYGKHTYNRQHTPYSEKYVTNWFRHVDEDGRHYQTRSRNGKIVRQYLDESPGVPLSNTWTDIMSLYGSAGWFPGNRTEITGYSTQKPLELYERIIKASSNKGDVVLDVFAGCATTAVAAERLGRQWVACDMAYRAWTMLKRRFLQNGWRLSGTTKSSYDAMAQVKAALPDSRPKTIRTKTIGPKELPKRDDVDPVSFHQLTTGKGRQQSTQTASWSGRISKDDAKQLLIRRFGPVCWGCGYEPRRPNGSLDDTLLEVDHIRARRAAQGAQGNDELYNLALLHRTCNGIKRNQMTLEQLREHNAMNSLLYVNTINDLVDLYEATQFAAEQIAIHTARYGLQTEMAELESDAAEASAPRLI